MPGDAPLVPTPEAAKRVGLSTRTIQRYVKAGMIKPDLVTAGGQFRWDTERLKAQINALREREDD